MSREADLNPNLGWPGGPCQVVERIEERVRAPRLREDLAEKVEQGDKLTNPEAAKVYTVETDRGGGMFRQIKITPHAQYRMDQRNITVNDLRLTLANFSKKLNDWKSRHAWEWDTFVRDTQRGEPIEWEDPKHSGLRTIFVHQHGTAVIISVYWKGLADPRPEMCGMHPRHAKHTAPVEDMSGFRTWVKDPSPSKSDTGESSDGKYPTQGLPSPPWVKNKPIGPTTLNMPGDSGSNEDGKSIHKDKARTKGTPGGQYSNGKTHPDPDITDTGITPKRRPGMTAEGDAPLLDEWDVEDLLPELVEAGYQPQFPSPHPPGNKRQKKQKGRAKRYFSKRYKRQKGKIKRLVTRRWRRLKNNNRFQVRRDKAKDLPKRHERRPGGGPSTIAERSKKQREKAKAEKKKATLPISFYHYPTGQWGEVYEVSPLGAVHIWLAGERGVADFETFFDEAVFDEADHARLFGYLDAVFEFEGEDELFEGEDEDPQFDAWLKMGYAGFRLKRRPDKRRRKQRGTDKVKAKLRYKKNRMKSRQQSRKRYKRLKKNPAFKKQQKIRRKHPERFKTRLGEVLTAPEIAFALDVGPDGEFNRTFGGDEGLIPGYVRNISGMTGLVHFWLAEPGSRMLRSLPVREFLTAVAFLSDEDMEAMYALVDAEVGIEAYGDPEITDSELINLYTIGSGFMHPREKREMADEHDELLRDPSDDDFYYGAVVQLGNQVIASFFREQQPPQMAPETVYDRGNDHDERARRKRQPGDSGINSPHDKEVEDSNPGSRVLPGDKGHVEKQATLISEIREGCGSELVSRSAGLAVKLARVDSKNAVWLFNVQGSESPYRVRLKAIRHGNVNDIQKAHIKVSCSCSFWQWQGPEFHAKQGDYLFGRPRGLATKPGVKDPNGQHRACKHVLAVLSHVTDKSWHVPQPQRLAARYLADSLRLGEMVAEFPEFEMRRRRVAARYLASMEVLDA